MREVFGGVRLKRLGGCRGVLRLLWLLRLQRWGGCCWLERLGWAERLQRLERSDWLLRFKGQCPSVLKGGAHPVWSGVSRMQSSASGAVAGQRSPLGSRVGPDAEGRGVASRAGRVRVVRERKGWWKLLLRRHQGISSATDSFERGVGGILLGTGQVTGCGAVASVRACSGGRGGWRWVTRARLQPRA